MTNLPPAKPVAIAFYDKANKRHLKLMLSGPYDGWIVYKHPEGHWVTLREATFADLQLLKQVGIL